MSTPRELIKGAHRSLGRIGRGRDMSAEQAADGFELLNQLLASLNGESLMLPSRTTEQLTYSASQSTYTIGASGADLTTVRPLQILDAFHRDGSGSDYSMQLMSFRRWGDINYKTVGTYPERLYYEPEYPLGKLHFDYQPTTSLTLHLISMKEITAFTDLDETINLPAEYDRYFRTHLAIELAPDYGMSVPQEVMFSADKAEKAIKRLARANREEVLTLDSGLKSRNRFNIISDRYNT